MDFIIGYAGISAEDWDVVFRSRSTFAGNGVKIYAKPLPKGCASYFPGYEIGFISNFAAEYKGNLRVRSELGMAVIYIDRPGSNSEIFAPRLLPSILTLPVRWDPSYGSQQEKAVARNALIAQLGVATSQAIRLLKILREEYLRRANKTPLLLPVRNFEATLMTDFLADVQNSLLIADDPEVTLRGKMDEYSRRFDQATEKVGAVQRKYFVNHKNIWFVAPGAALHGQFHPVVTNHPDECILRSFNRLGAPYKPGFHYDCRRPTQPVLKDDFHKCHLPRSPAEGNPHLNIAPNDAVR